ncbi:hypothetical protein BJ138DRAFT_1194544 [Hygrophoropsis aurantiaca]|uniref:Uncharacterized protein n=1 Tax=Hygrophoropsis aurantiaca TaxID=72124 RepID=A0ACB7ZR27_9AGAM|nr:hypothetical protein BJ138DRAFT_1194544 [Hygrophoropsis aurantiaca]
MTLWTAPAQEDGRAWGLAFGGVQVGSHFDLRMVVYIRLVIDGLSRGSSVRLLGWGENSRRWRAGQVGTLSHRGHVVNGFQPHITLRDIPGVHSRRRIQTQRIHDVFPAQRIQDAFPATPTSTSTRRQDQDQPRTSTSCKINTPALADAAHRMQAGAAQRIQADTVHRMQAGAGHRIQADTVHVTQKAKKLFTLHVTQKAGKLFTLLGAQQPANTDAAGLHSTSNTTTSTPRSGTTVGNRKARYA